MLTILAKDLLIELRRREVLPAMLVFALLVVLVFSFAFELDPIMARSAASGVVWVTLVFTSMLGFYRSFAGEQDRHTLDGILLAPVSRLAIIMGKLLAVWLYVVITGLVILPIYSLLANINLIQPMIIGVMLLGTLGFCTAGIFISALASHTRAREVLLPVMLLPIGVPLLLAAVRSTNAVLQGAGWSALQEGGVLILGFDVIMLVAVWLLGDKLLGE
jgi:heme exporter protein B